MTCQLAEMFAGSGGLAAHTLLDSTAMPPGMIVAQVMKWLPVWLTPIWVISIGLLLGALISAIVYGFLALLSFVPAIGRLPDSPNRGVVASLVLGGVLAAGLCFLYVPQQGEYVEALFLPLIAIGLVLGFGVVYGAWFRTRSEWPTILTEGVVPYLLSVAGVFALIGLVSTPLVSEPRDIIDSIAAVNLVGDGTETLTVTVPPMGDDASVFHPADINYTLRNVAELTIESDKTVLLADASEPTGFSRSPFRVDPGDELRYRYEDRDTPPIPGDSSRLHIQNREIDPATVVFSFRNVPMVPEASSIVWVAAFFFFHLYFGPINGA